jgi:hypothetical protein
MFEVSKIVAMLYGNRVILSELPVVVLVDDSRKIIFCNFSGYCRIWISL